MKEIDNCLSENRVIFNKPSSAFLHAIFSKVSRDFIFIWLSEQYEEIDGNTEPRHRRRIGISAKSRCFFGEKPSAYRRKGNVLSATRQCNMATKEVSNRPNSPFIMIVCEMKDTYCLSTTLKMAFILFRKPSLRSVKIASIFLTKQGLERETKKRLHRKGHSLFQKNYFNNAST